MARILETLERHPLFADLPRYEIASLVLDCRFRTPFRGDRIVSAGDPADGFFLVVSGSVKLSRVDPGAREHVAEVLQAGDTVGLLAVLEGECHAMTATVLTNATVIRIARPAFLRLLARRPEMHARTLREVAARTQQLRERLEEMATRSVPERVARHILRLAEQDGGHARGRGVDLGATRDVVANGLGTVREVFVRTLRGMEREGLVSIDGRRVVVLQTERLRGVAEGRERLSMAGARRAVPARRAGPAAALPVRSRVGAL